MSLSHHTRVVGVVWSTFMAVIIHAPIYAIHVPVCAIMHPYAHQSFHHPSVSTSPTLQHAPAEAFCRAMCLTACSLHSWKPRPHTASSPLPTG